MKPSLSTSLTIPLLCLLVVNRGMKEEPWSAIAATAGASPTDVICSYAPSQSNVVSHLSAVAGGSAIAATTIAQAIGLTAVLHSSGAYIFTGTSGYVAGTIGGAAAIPATVTIGLVVAGGTASLELICAPKNHPALAAKVESAAREFADRSKQSINSTVKATGPIIADVKDVVVKASANAFDYANRTSIEWSQAIRATIK
jgi:hypothetical protein